MNTNNFDPESTIKNVEELRALYGGPSKKAVIKELDHVSPHYERFVNASPFVVIASVGPEGLDTSPRGDTPGFVRVVDPYTIMLPDRRGNNRADTLLNIVHDPRVSLLFLIPGVGETLRVIGRARIVIDKRLCASFAVNKKLPRSVLVISVECVYFQCQKAVVRSGLWDAGNHVDRSTLPTAGDMLQAVDQAFDGAIYDDTYADHMEKTIY